VKILISKTQWQQAGIKAGWIIQESQSNITRNIPIGNRTAPSPWQVYFWNRRIVNRQQQTHNGGFHRKEYTVRIYSDGSGGYEVWAFNGRINAVQVPHPKGSFHSLAEAIHHAEYIVNSKISDGYRPASEYGMTDFNLSIVGRQENDADVHFDPASISNQTISEPNRVRSPLPHATKNDVQIHVKNPSSKTNIPPPNTLSPIDPPKQKTHIETYDEAVNLIQDMF
jgi:hypothetical protein